MDQPLDSSTWGLYHDNASDGGGVNSQHSLNQSDTFAGVLSNTMLDWNQSSSDLDWMLDSVSATDSRDSSNLLSSHLNLPTAIDSFDAVQEVYPLSTPRYHVVNLDTAYNPEHCLDKLPVTHQHSPTAVSAFFDTNDENRNNTVSNDRMIDPVVLEAAFPKAVSASRHVSVNNKGKAEIIDQQVCRREPQYDRRRIGHLQTARASASSFSPSYSTILEQTDPPGLAIDACCLWLSSHPGQTPSEKVILGIHLAFDASRESLLQWFKRYRQRCSSQYQMADSDVTAPYRDNRNKCIKLDRSSRASQSSITIRRDDQRPYACTSRCGATFKTKDDWRKHEEINYPQRLWCCTLSGCDSGSLTPRVSFRKEHFVTHLTKAHGLNDIGGKDIDANYLPIASRFSRRCLFQDCSEVLDTWKARIDHLAQHFVKPWHISEWRPSENDTVSLIDDKEDRHTAQIMDLGDHDGQCPTNQLHSNFNDKNGPQQKCRITSSAAISPVSIDPPRFSLNLPAESVPLMLSGSFNSESRDTSQPSFEILRLSQQIRCSMESDPRAHDISIALPDISLTTESRDHTCEQKTCRNRNGKEDLAYELRGSLLLDPNLLQSSTVATRVPAVRSGLAASSAKRSQALSYTSSQPPAYAPNINRVTRIRRSYGVDFESDEKHDDKCSPSESKRGGFTIPFRNFRSKLVSAGTSAPDMAPKRSLFSAGIPLISWRSKLFQKSKAPRM